MVNEPVAIGGDLSQDMLLDAYSKGIFPWYSNNPILWFSPDPRMVATKDKLHISKSLARVIQANKFEIRTNSDFINVIRMCKVIKRKNQSDTWINTEMMRAYIKLHKSGYAHSIEAYINNKLVGGLYGVALGKVFFGESMFSCVSNASKVAFAYLLTRKDYKLVDCQIYSEHLKSLGAFNVERVWFMQQLKNLL